MGTIKQCTSCGKRTDYYTVVQAFSVQGDHETTKWRTILCSECARATSIEEASIQAEEQITRDT